MENELKSDAFRILEEAFSKNEPVLLHKLIGSIDARHHLILNLNEINSAIDLIGGIRKDVDGNEVKLNPPDAKKSDCINDKDMERAMKIYNDYLNR